MLSQNKQSKHKYSLKSIKKYSFASPNNTLKLYDHSAVCWGKHMFIWGGDNNKLSKLPIKKQSNFHKVHIDSRTWETMQSSAVIPPHVHSQCSQVYQDEMFIFGGSDESCKSNNAMWGYSFIGKIFKRHHGLYPPTARESASMVRIGKYFLIYGGVNLQAKQIYNQFYLYEVKLMKWFLLTPTREIPIRTFQKMVEVGNVVYLFGGNDESGVSSLNDFYKITLIETKQIQIQKIQTARTPPSRMSHGMISYADRYVIMIGGQKQLRRKSQFLNDAWIYDTVLCQWNEIDMKGKFQPRSHFSIVQYKNQLVIFGGMKQEGVDDTMIIIELEDLNPPQKKQIQFQQENKLQMSVFCQYSPIQKPNLQFFLKSSSLIKFPFAAFGLLIDNCINSQANTISISVVDRAPSSTFFNNRGTPQKQKQLNPLNRSEDVQRFIHIQDDGRTWSNQQFPHILFNSQVNDSLLSDVLDKKTKISVSKQNLKKQFGINLKFGCFRLGQAFLYISGYQNFLRVGLMAAGGQKDKREFYTYYYCEDLRNKKFITQNGAEVKKAIESICKSILRPRILDELTTTNQLYIFNLEAFYTVRGTYYQLNPYNNDYIYNCMHQVEFLDKISFPILQCPDVSLRSYLSLLYLKNQTRITLQTNKKAKQQILNQLFIEKIDKQKQKGLVKEIQYANLYPQLAECKIVELYYDQAMDQRCDSFHPGILIYHKNRLILRYQYQLGRLFQLKFYPRRYRKGKTNVLQFFGYIQLPDEMNINIFKTGVENQILLQGFNSNIQLIIKDMKRRIQSKSKPETIPNYLQIYDKYGQEKNKQLKHIARKQILSHKSQLSQDQQDQDPIGSHSGSISDDQESEYEESQLTPIKTLLEQEHKKSSKQSPQK